MPEPCLEYRGHRSTSGYGRFYRPEKPRKYVQLTRYIVERIEGRELSKDEVVMHLCDNPPCFRYSHLRVGSRSDNTQDARAKGRLVGGGDRNWARGERLPQTVLTEPDVREVKRRLAEGETKSAIARDLGVHRNTISDIAFGRNWKWVA